ncbi:MAG: hypothetical protein ACREBJ_00020 [Nitrosotalea sp.]
MSSESNFAYSIKYNTTFTVKNITGSKAASPYEKTIFIFNYPINHVETRDLLQIPGVQEADIRASLLKGVLRHKFLCGDISLVYSNIDLLQFSDKQRAFLYQFGFTEGVQVGWDELDGYVQGQIGSGGGGGITPTEHETLRQLIHFIDEGPGDGFASGAFKEVLPTGSPFPTSITWYLNVAKTLKLVEKFVTYNANKFPTAIHWNMYDYDGVTIVHTVIDTITYSTAFESTRTRTIS